MISLRSLSATFIVLIAPGDTLYFSPVPERLTVLQSKFHDGATISYKEPGIWETTEGVLSYSGFVHWPSKNVNEIGELLNYPINTFFWCFEARKDPHRTPLTI